MYVIKNFIKYHNGMWVGYRFRNYIENFIINIQIYKIYIGGLGWNTQIIDKQ